MKAPRTETWKKLWATPVELDEEATEDVFDELSDALVPRHMQARFAKRFGVPKERFGNRFFVEGAVFRDWSVPLSQLGAEGTHADVDVVVGSGDEMRGYRLRGQTRRTLKDIFIDDSQAVCAIARTPNMTLYMFTETGMKGAIVRVGAGGDSELS